MRKFLQDLLTSILKEHLKSLFLFLLGLSAVIRFRDQIIDTGKLVLFKRSYYGWQILLFLIALSTLVAILYTVSQYPQKRRKKALIRRFEELISRGRRLKERFSRAKGYLSGEDRIDYDQYKLSCSSLLLRAFGKDSIYAKAFYNVTHGAAGASSEHKPDWGELYSRTFDGWLAVIKSALEELQNS